MATTVAPESKVKPGKIGGGLNGGKGGGGPNGGGPDGPRKPPPMDQYRLGMWVALASIAMLFAGLTSAYVYSTARRTWPTITLPYVLWLSTGLIVGSSLALELARRALKRDLIGRFNQWLLTTTILGAGFLLSQVVAWRQLVGQGIYINTNPHSSFFYLLTGAHAVHLVGGFLGLLYVIVGAWRRRFTSEQRIAVDVTSIYWHFMDGLWLYLFVLLLVWR